MNLKDELLSHKEKAKTQLESAQTLDELEQIRIQYFGKKGKITQSLKGMKDLSNEEKPEVGKIANQVRTELTNILEEKEKSFQEQALHQKLVAESIDVTLPGDHRLVGQTHVLTQVIEQIENLFLGMGYEIVDGYEVETDHYNFERLNVPQDHPARDMQDTFYFTHEFLLRTQTSATQPRTLETHDFNQGPLKMISPGKVYRRDTDDATHSHQFHQIEGLVVDQNITMADLKGTLEILSQEMFGAQREIRLRPSYFPFTEPSVEVDVSCFKCEGAGCNICKQSGWIEVLGAGMVHPNVLEMSGIDSTTYSGFAFGLGPDRIAMLKYGVEDIRDFYLNDQRFLKQFQVKG